MGEAKCWAEMKVNLFLSVSCHQGNTDVPHQSVPVLLGFNCTLDSIRNIGVSIFKVAVG